jgi:3-hydroxymyristoyl/3-hydroxydecanoyl-(acyl carrier protein) dehydratase
MTPEGRWESSVRFEPSSEWFSGHFDEYPLAPGVALLALVAETVKRQGREQGRLLQVSGFFSVRFRRLVLPGEELLISVSAMPPESEAKLDFRVTCHGHITVRGVLKAIEELFETPAKDRDFDFIADFETLKLLNHILVESAAISGHASAPKRHQHHLSLFVFDRDFCAILLNDFADDFSLGAFRRSLGLLLLFSNRKAEADKKYECNYCVSYHVLSPISNVGKTSGNFIKVVQVVPVKISVQNDQHALLIPGTSVEVKIKVQ